uniref:Gustatory receptor n=1 Tax=Protaetia brevitarsis TaxID=348688 RepID=A0A411HRE2_PROBE|nr:gustatory receptor [Protaetia brevitarsis]
MLDRRSIRITVQMKGLTTRPRDDAYKKEVDAREILYTCRKEGSLYTATIFFYLNGFSVILLFLKLATKWPDFMQYWQDTEVFIRCKIILPNRYSYVLFLIIGAAIVEHTLLITYSMTAEEYKKYQTNNTTRFEHFLARDSHIFKHISYTWYMGTFVKVISLANTFYWNFMDVFIIAMSIALAAMLKLINYRIRAARQVRAIIWTDLRRNYDRICELSFRVEDIMSPLILTSFASNLYFILVQLHGSVK